MATNAGDYIYVGPWGPGQYDSSQRMFEHTLGEVDKTTITGFQAYRKNALMYQGLVRDRQGNSEIDAGRSRAQAAASGAGMGSVAARNYRQRMEQGMSKLADMPSAPTAPEVSAPKRTYIDPRRGYGLFNYGEGQYSDTGATGQSSLIPEGERGIAGYNRAYNTLISQGADLSNAGTAGSRQLFAGLNLQLRDYAEQAGDFKLLTELGQPAWSPEQFDTIKSTYEKRYQQDVKDYEELQSLKSTTIDKGQTGDPDYEKYKAEVDAYDASSGRARKAAGAAGDSGSGGQVGIGPENVNTSPGLEFVKRDDNAWI